ncbi:L,D-transpeptidase [Maritalea porphyrae]|uniref:L,D-transpeptidase n=1 Tax=Maritalea porphyrae TaxID=880732 RepID=A0ABQ5UTM3_9HYPH|nr:L,D-transpeptidase [Maritalea porphyrae]GLQ18070.1 L,D-transpeptidase [Maritalea porphyrae]
MKIFKIGAAVLMSLVMLSFVTTTAQAKRVYDPIKKEWYDTDDVTRGARGGSKIKRQEVAYETKYKAGTIIVETSERRLYLVLGNGRAMKYGVGVGRDGFRWAGTHRITRKAEWPGWTPPPAMRKRVPGLPAYMPGGPKNPLGARALYIGSTIYRLHGTAEPWTIGHAVSSGCIRLTNNDIVDLYNRTKVGARVIVRH